MRREVARRPALAHRRLRPGRAGRARRRAGGVRTGRGASWPHPLRRGGAGPNPGGPRGARSLGSDGDRARAPHRRPVRLVVGDGRRLRRRHRSTARATARATASCSRDRDGLRGVGRLARPDGAVRRGPARGPGARRRTGGSSTTVASSAPSPCATRSPRPSSSRAGTSGMPSRRVIGAGRRHAPRWVSRCGLAARRGIDPVLVTCDATNTASARTIDVVRRRARGRAGRRPAALGPTGAPARPIGAGPVETRAGPARAGDARRGRRDAGGGAAGGLGRGLPARGRPRRRRDDARAGRTRGRRGTSSGRSDGLVVGSIGCFGPPDERAWSRSATASCRRPAAAAS